MASCIHCISSNLPRILLIGLYSFAIYLTPSSTAQSNDSGNSAQKDTRSLVTLQNNGYTNLVIAINERVPEDPNLITRIKQIFESTSKFLYKATNQRAYFNDIRIIIPESWSDSDTYQPIQNERYDISDVRIDLPSDNFGDLPYTNKPTPCGVPGLYIHLTPNYLTDDDIAGKFGDYDRVLVHEWGHYRWGVFDEYPLPGMSHFYAASNGDIEAVRCVLAIPGVPATESGEACRYNNNGLPDANCRFVDDRFADGYTGSLMYKQFLPRITTFCEADPIGPYVGNVHNREAPNRQNILCDGRSIWEVLLDHVDFKDNANPPSDMEDPLPTFTLVKKYNTRLVLVLDMSGSMEGERLRQLRQAASNLILNILRDGEELGIVSFSGGSRILAYLTVVGDDTKDDLLNKLPSRADGATSIGAGVARGLEVLKSSSNGVAGGRMLVITDGDENTTPYIADILNNVKAAGIRIDTIAIGTEASQELEVLAAVTGGTSYYHTNTSNTLNEAFGELTRNSQDDSTKVTVDLYSKSVDIAPAAKYQDIFLVDSNIGRNTQFNFGYSLDEGVDVIVTSPSGSIIDKSSAEYSKDDRFGSLQIKLEEVAEVGEWKFEIENLASEEQLVTVTVQSQSREEGDEPIVTNARWGLDDVTPPDNQMLYVTVAKGYTPVINTQVEASVAMPSGDDVRLVLEDNGIGADITSNDGIYSTFFTEFGGIGRYSVQVNVQSDASNTYIASGSIVGIGAVVDPDFVSSKQVEDNTQTRHVSTGVFQRITNGGSFTCNSQDDCTGTKDIYPPSRITDLVADSVHIGSFTVEITFTAPGDDLTNGKATYYEIRMGTNFTQLYEDFAAGDNITELQLVKGDLATPKPSGSRELFVIKVPEIIGDFSYVFAVVAFDDGGNQSPRSNLATSTARDYRKPISYLLPVLLGVGLFVLVVLLIICIVFIVCRRSKRTEEDVERSKTKTKVVTTSLPDNGNDTPKPGVNVRMQVEFMEKQAFLQPDHAV
ncbi:calcium-activated chloride channel regulator 1-like isoform X2 [Amphiura filiformis]|uniref:calcium-activated chloride channel regulator 1-like isoform X2 n=1 Tax=Amphiura filiformis TaxID=82378 RepID=UPI003B2250A3